MAVIPEGKSRKVQSRFTQMIDGKKTHCSYSRFNHRFLSVKRQQRKNTQIDGVIDLSFLQSQVKETKHFPLAIIAAALLSALAGAMAFILFQFSAYLLLAPALLSVSLIAFAFQQRQHSFQFLSLTGDVPILEVNALHPDKAMVSAFMIDLQQAIETASALLPQGKKRTPLIVAEMRRLKDSGFIDECQYESIKQALFTQA